MDLYVSDLDGTLLTPEAEVSPWTRDVLSGLIGRGMHFTVATARTAATTLQLLGGIPLLVPVILMNGACIYDVQSGVYLKAEGLSQAGRKALFTAIREHGLAGFIYRVSNNRLATFYERADTPEAKRFIEERERKYGKVFCQVDHFEQDLDDDGLVYYSISSTRERLDPARDSLEGHPDLHVAYYRDIYEPDHWYLEVSSIAASKKKAVAFLRDYGRYNQVTCFGDNLNDLPMFEACDVCLAVANALPEVIARATATIGSNRDDGVARWLLDHVR